MLRIAFFLLLQISLFGQSLKVDLKAQTAILINAETGSILYEKESRRQMFPASITKIATAIYTLEKSGAKLESLATANQECVGFVTEGAKKKSNYTLPAHYLEFGATHMVIHKGEKFTLRDLLYGHMVHSADDASNVIALHVGGTIPKFMHCLNEYVKEIGCRDTQFKNPHGLHHPDHYTTAYDMAILTAHAMKNRQFKEIVSTTRWTRPKTEFQPAMTLLQGNRLLRKGECYYPKAIGVKTGFTSAAQNTLVAAAQHNGRTLIAVLMKTKERKEMFKDAIKLFEAAFNQPMLERTLLPAGELPHSTKAENHLVRGYLLEPLTLQYYPAEVGELKALLQWNELSLPVEKGQVIGEVIVEDSQGNRLTSTEIFAVKRVGAYGFPRSEWIILLVGIAIWLIARR